MSLLTIDGTTLQIEGKKIAGTFLASAAKDSFHYEGVIPYYRRRQPNGSVKVWLRSERASFEIVVSPDYAAMLKPNIPITLDFSLS